MAKGVQQRAPVFVTSAYLNRRRAASPKVAGKERTAIHRPRHTGPSNPSSHRPCFFSQACISAISRSCSLMMASAIFLVSESFACFSATLAMSTAPW